MTASAPTIVVFGSSTLAADSPECQVVRALGQRLAESGARVVSGGYHGVMGAISEGAHGAGGAVLGVTLGAFADRRPNPWLTDEILAPDLYSRLRTLTETPDAYVVAAGNVGTLTELFLTWNLAMLHLVPQRPIVLLGTHWQDLLDHLRDTGLVPDHHLALLTVTHGVDDTLAALAVVLPENRPAPQ